MVKNQLLAYCAAGLCVGSVCQDRPSVLAGQTNGSSVVIRCGPSVLLSCCVFENKQHAKRGDIRNRRPVHHSAGRIHATHQRCRSLRPVVLRRLRKVRTGCGQRLLAQCQQATKHIRRIRMIYAQEGFLVSGVPSTHRWPLAIKYVGGFTAALLAIIADNQLR